MRRRSFLAVVASIITYQGIKAYIRFGDRIFSPPPTPTPSPLPWDTPTRVRARNPFKPLSPLPTPTPHPVTKKSFLGAKK